MSNVWIVPVFVAVMIAQVLARADIKRSPGKLSVSTRLTRFDVVFALAVTAALSFSLAR